MAIEPQTSTIAAAKPPPGPKPKLKAPRDAADCHIHIYDARFQHSGKIPSNSTADDYRQLQQHIGTSRVVIVTPRNYATDNAVTVDAIAQLGIANARGVAVLRPNVTDADLKRLDQGGIRGLRFTVGNPQTAVVSIDMIEPLAKRIADLGWHVQLNMEPEQIVDSAKLLRRLPTPIVFDHMGKLGVSGLDHPSYAIMHGLVEKDRAWVKISGAYINTRIGPPSFSDATAAAHKFVRAAPERLVWGTDWPHPSAKEKPDDAALLDLLAVWAADEKIRDRILVHNPEALYGFPKSA